jgi:hypothetical protein
MDKIAALSLGRKLVLGAGVLLFIDMFLHWQSVDLGGFGTASANGWHGFWGVVLGLMTIAIVGWVAARAFGVDLPANVPDGTVTLTVGVLIFLFALIKNLADDYSAWASYVGIVLGAVVAYGGWLIYKDSGETLPGMSNAAATAGGGNSTTPPPSVPSPPPDEPTS